MYIYRKRSKKQQKLAERGKICPSCKSASLMLTEPGRDRVTFTCKKCGAISTFTNLPDTVKKQTPETNKYTAITVRDHSNKTDYATQMKPKALQNETLQARLTVIRDAMKNTVILSFDYTASDKRKSARNIEPYKITTRNGEIILFGYDLESGGIRTFKMKNMTYVEPQNYGYKPRFAIEDKLKDKDA